MAQDETRTPKHNTSEPNDSSNASNKSKRSGQRKPVSLAPMTVDEALQRTFAAGPMPKKPRTKAKHHHGGATTTPKSKPTKGAQHTKRLKGR